MDTTLISIGTMAVPVGLIVALASFDHSHSLAWFLLGVIGIIAAIIGLICCLWVLRHASKKEKDDEGKQKHRDEVSEDTLSELKALNQYLKGRGR